MAFRPRKFRTWWQERGLKLACIWLVVTNVKMARTPSPERANVYCRAAPRARCPDVYYTHPNERAISLSPIFLELPVSVVERAHLTGLEPTRDAMKMKGVVALSPAHHATGH